VPKYKSLQLWHIVTEFNIVWATYYQLSIIWHKWPPSKDSEIQLVKSYICI